MKKVLTLAISIALLIACISGFSVIASAAEVTLDGNGSAEEPYLIDDAADFISVFGNGGANAELIAGEAENHFRQTSEMIVLTNYTPTTEAFYGTYDGNDFTIKIESLSSGLTKNIGLFSTVSGTVKNLTVDGEIDTTGTNVGGIAGYVNSGDIVGCTNLAEITGAKSIGGIAGAVQSGSTVKNCVNRGDVTGSGNYIGGIAGELHGGTSADSIIFNCANYGSVSGTSTKDRYIGGIVGRAYNKSVEIIKCFNAGDVTKAGTSGGVSAIVGGNVDKGADKITIADCFNTGTLTGGASQNSAFGYYNSSYAVTSLVITNYYDIANPTISAYPTDLTIATVTNARVRGLNGETEDTILNAYASNSDYESTQGDGYDYPNFAVTGDVTVAYDSEIGGKFEIKSEEEQTEDVVIGENTNIFTSEADDTFVPTTTEGGEQITTAYAVVMGKFSLKAGIDENDIEYGMFISKTVSGADLTEKTCTKEAKALKNYNGAYGILFYGNMTKGDEYYVRPYVKYDGEYTYGTPSLFVFDAE